jgi:hypothetical protein
MPNEQPASDVHMPLKSTETDLIAKWVVVEGKMAGDEVEQRINALIHGELQKLGHDSSGWETLYRDPSDGRLWELTRPQSEMHGGGPRRLHVIEPEEARRKYGSVGETLR